MLTDYQTSFRVAHENDWAVVHIHDSEGKPGTLGKCVLAAVFARPTDQPGAAATNEYRHHPEVDAALAQLGITRDEIGSDKRYTLAVTRKVHAPN